MTSRVVPKPSSTQSGRERRGHERVSASIPMSADLEGTSIRIMGGNLSEGGLSGCTEVPIPIMTRLEINLDLPAETDEVQGAPLRLRAVVVRCEPHPSVGANWNFALFFVDPEPGARERLARYIRSRQRAGGGQGGDA